MRPPAQADVKVASLDGTEASSRDGGPDGGCRQGGSLPFPFRYPDGRDKF